MSTLSKAFRAQTRSVFLSFIIMMRRCWDFCAGASAKDVPLTTERKGPSFVIVVVGWGCWPYCLLSVGVWKPKFVQYIQCTGTLRYGSNDVVQHKTTCAPSSYFPRRACDSDRRVVLNAFWWSMLLYRGSFVPYSPVMQENNNNNIRTVNSVIK